LAVELVDGFGVGAVFHFFGEAGGEEKHEEKEDVDGDESSEAPGVEERANENEGIEDEEAEEAASGGEFIFGEVGEFVVGDGFDLVGRKFGEETGGKEEFVAEGDGVGERER
jgi:hypothetical protein